MKLMKTFDLINEIMPYLESKGIDCDLIDVVYFETNNRAVSYSVGEPDTKIQEIVDEYLLLQGCQYGEKVFIWIS